MPRIRKLNRFLGCHTQVEYWHEAHPELFFQRLNKDVPLSFKKRESKE
jgi:predicted RNase H-like nuclease